ncbi:MAG: hypothetical protein INR70_31320 [Parafilimonas terrae]|nr:hypothetical protein [Parafilimonas terrae]
MKRWVVLPAAALVLPHAASGASTEGAEAALRILLAGASLAIPHASSCYGVIPSVPRPTLGDLVATPLAGLDRGVNRVEGGCERGRCRIRISHRAGEDVFSHEFRFRTAQGRLVPASLRCLSTP